MESALHIHFPVDYWIECLPLDSKDYVSSSCVFRSPSHKVQCWAGSQRTGIRARGCGRECAGPRNDGEEAEGRGRIWWGSKKICGELWKTESEAPRERPLSLLLMFESGLRLSKNEDFKSSIIRKRANWVHKEHIKIRYNPLSHKSTV